MARSRCGKVLVLTALAVCVTGGCPFFGGLVPSFQDAQSSLTNAIGMLVGATDPSVAADKMDAAAAMLVASATDVDQILDGANFAFGDSISSLEQYTSLVEHSILLNGRHAGEIEVGAAAAKAAVQGRESTCGDGSPTVVIFVNGINNSLNEFTASNAALAKLIQDNPKKLTVTGFYNVSGKDREKSIFGGYLCPFACKIAKLFALGPLYQPVKRACDAACQGAGVLLDAGQAAEQGLNEWCKLLPDPLDSKRFRDVIKSYTDKGYTVIIVAHSQGNFMAQQALADLTAPEPPYDPPADSVGVISVGSPTTSKFACFDSNQISIMVENEAMKLLPGTASGNVPDPTGSEGNGPVSRLARHSFNESYLRSGIARAMIKKEVARMACDLYNARGKSTCPAVRIHMGQVTDWMGRLQRLRVVTNGVDMTMQEGNETGLIPVCGPMDVKLYNEKGSLVYGFQMPVTDINAHAQESPTLNIWIARGLLTSFALCYSSGDCSTLLIPYGPYSNVDFTQ